LISFEDWEIRKHCLKQQNDSNYYTTFNNNSVNGLNSLIKIHRLACWIKKHDLINFHLQVAYLTVKDKCQLKMKGCKKIFQLTCGREQAGITVFTSYKVDFKAKLVRRDKDQLILIMRITYQGDISNCKHIRTEY
jgi:hypothetical protein